MNNTLKKYFGLAFLLTTFFSANMDAKAPKPKEGHERKEKKVVNTTSHENTLLIVEPGTTIQSGCPTCTTLNFTFPSKLCIGRSVIFTNISTACTGNLNAMWDFGDGSPASASPYHLFSTPGTYQVKFFIPETPDCSEKSVIKTISVGACRKCVQGGAG